ncbi:hypothetical protein IAU60_004337 [Kwoniella sp. DSM 27419]
MAQNQAGSNRSGHPEQGPYDGLTRADAQARLKKRPNGHFAMEFLRREAFSQSQTTSGPDSGGGVVLGARDEISLRHGEASALSCWDIPPVPPLPLTSQDVVSEQDVVSQAQATTQAVEILSTHIAYATDARSQANTRARYREYKASCGILSHHIDGYPGESTKTLEQSQTALLRATRETINIAQARLRRHAAKLNTDASQLSERAGYMLAGDDWIALSAQSQAEALKPYREACDELTRFEADTRHLATEWTTALGKENVVQAREAWNKLGKMKLQTDEDIERMTKMSPHFLE